jgi:hypothetical protein
MNGMLLSSGLTVKRWWPVIFRTALYFSIPVTLALADKLAPFADKDTWPSRIKWVVFLLVAVGQGLIAVRAYLDGSAQRHADQLHSGDTQFLLKQSPPDTKTP